MVSIIILKISSMQLILSKFLELIRPTTCLISIASSNPISGEIYNLKSLYIIKIL